MSKMFKKSCSLVLAVALLLSMAVVNVLAGDSAETGLTVEQIEGNILTDGSFENGVSGWSAENATVTKTMDETYGDTAGAGLVTRSEEDGYIFQNVSVRKYTWYTFSAWVKMAEGTANAKVVIDYGTDSWNAEAETKELASETIGTEWTELKGYFFKYDATGKSETTDFSTDADFFINAKISLAVSGSADYYVDEFKASALDGIYNSDFSDTNLDDNWGLGSTAQTLSVTDGVLEVTSTDKNKYLQTALCVENGVLYEFTATVKIDIADADIEKANHVRARTSVAVLNSGTPASTQYLGHATFLDNEWVTIKATYINNGTGKYDIVPLRMYPTFNGSATPAGTYYVKEFNFKKVTNLLDAPYFNDATKLDSYYKGAWKYANNLTVEASKVATLSSEAISGDAISTYDKSNTRLKFVPSGTSFTTSTVHQDLTGKIEEGRKYDISVALRTDADGTGTYVLTSKNYSDTEGVSEVNDYMLDTGSTQLDIPKTWTVVEAKNFEFNLPEGYSKSSIGIRTWDAVGKNVYIDDFSITPVYEAPVVESASIGSAAAGFALSAPTLTVEESIDDYSYRYRYILYDTESAESGKTVISGHTNVGESIGSSNVPSDWKNKYLALEITPVSDKGVWGESFTTEKVLVEEAYTITPNVGNGYTGDIEAEGTITANVTVKNNDATNTLPVAVIIAYFESGRLVATNLEDKAVANGSPETFTPSVTLPKTLGENPSVKVFVWKGYDGESFKMQPLTESYPKN